MNRNLYTIRIIILLTILVYPATLQAQQDGCRVLKTGISEKYEGGCKKGLASGKGIAQGADRYEGEFTRGLPDGRGTYKWANGVYYEGEWKNGLREGAGRMVYPDSVVTGFWREDRYLGKEKVPPYKIVSTLSVPRYSVVKTTQRTPGVRIRLMQGGTDNISVSDFSMAYDSGSEYRSGAYYGLENVSFPLTLKIKYTSQNMLKTSSYRVIFDVILTDPGSWEITLDN